MRNTLARRRTKAPVSEAERVFVHAVSVADRFPRKFEKTALKHTKRIGEICNWASVSEGNKPFSLNEHINTPQGLDRSRFGGFLVSDGDTPSLVAFHERYWASYRVEAKASIDPRESFSLSITPFDEETQVMGHRSRFDNIESLLRIGGPSDIGFMAVAVFLAESSLKQGR